MEYSKDGRSYEERTHCPLMDGIGYVTELLNSQERESNKEYMHTSNKFFDKLYQKKIPRTAWEVNRKRNRILNETVKNSSPQFYVEQSFKANTVDDEGEYHFKLDPEFMNCNSVYKTIGLRGVYMKPKRYTLHYACNLNITVPAAHESLALANMPIMHYTYIGYQQYLGEDRLESIEATIYDSEQNKYLINYRQNYRTGKVISLYLKINDHPSVTVENISYISDYDIGDGKTVDFTFDPSGEINITTNYTESSIRYSIDETFTKEYPYDIDDTTCVDCERTKYAYKSTIDVTSNFSLTLLPENSIEVFAYEVCKQVNEKLKSDSDDHVNVCEIEFDYDSNHNTLVFHFNSSEDGVRVEGRFVPIDSKHLSENLTFNHILNQADYPADPKYSSDIVFTNVWDRENFFVHATYMNLTEYNQLDRTGNLYPKPTKLTRYTSSSPDIYFWTSVNGTDDKFVLVDQEFEVNVALAGTLNNADITF